MKYLIIGGSGFIGCNLSFDLLKKGNEVIVIDNFSRRGSVINSNFLKNSFPNIKIIKADITIDQKILEKEIKKADVVFHLAAQVAVTTSVINPREDFKINALGTLNVLEAARRSPKNPILIFSSTNKVYGEMSEQKIVKKEKRYKYKNLPLGVGEDQNLDFHSPYGCSKGSADQYVRDYARIYNLPTVVFRQSCIYGPHQFGMEDQGWIAWFVISSILGKPITIYGDGRQVRDILYVNDLVNAYELAVKNIKKTAGKVYNIGGGPDNTLSLLELIDYLEKLLGKKIKFSFSGWRQGDQLVYVSDIRKAKKDFGWKPETGVKDGVSELYSWVKDNKNLFLKL